uniref:Lipocalin/cytosolic fatty-acid binding domain-containing protein n=1 Tax=Clastoptera arizonana TaxID=38151 RepID=A0A1B6D925_9HEMI
MFSRYLLLLVLAVCCWADDSVTATEPLAKDGDDSVNVEGENCPNTTTSFQNPYDFVTHCSGKLIANILKGFDFNEIVNSGNYKFLYSSILNPVLTKCAFGNIYGDKNIGFKAAATFVDSNNQTSSVVYGLTPTVDGTIDEILTLDDGSTYKFILVPLAFEKDIGVLYYGRCSINGRGKTENRNIVVSQCNADSDRAKEIVEDYVKRDAASGYKGRRLVKFQTCSK